MRWTLRQDWRKYLLRIFVCRVIGHKVNEGEFIDSHDNWDALSYCERCGELDV